MDSNASEDSLQVPRPQPLRLRSGGKGNTKPLEKSGPAQTLAKLSGDTDIEKLSQKLLPADGGPGAWKFLFAASMIEAFMLGLPLNYGVFQNYYFEHEPFRGDKNLATVGTLGTCFVLLGAPIATPIIERYPRWHREFIWLGWVVAMAGLASASFAQGTTTLIATQGFTYGVGVLIMYYPIIHMLNEWFVLRRGLALGIFSAATGISGLGMPFALEALLIRYGWRITLRITAIFLIFSCGPLIPLFKNRLPKNHRAKGAHTDYSFLKMSQFYLFSFATLLQGLGMYFPMIYLPSYASSLRLDPVVGAALLAVPSLSQIIGQVGFGFVSDLRIKNLFMDRRMPVHILAFISTFTAGICVFTLWGLARSLPTLVMFSFMFGIFGGGYVVLWARMVSRKPQAQEKGRKVVSCKNRDV
ncbi:MAG: hypothetical protein Q9167_003121 [Letrouitia subvulpina]